MKLLPAFAAAALAAVSFSAVAAPAGYVSYRCDSGKKLNVMYEFDRNGNAVGADVNAAGTKANLRVDRRRSDDTGTTFSNRRGYVMSAGYIGRDTHTTSEVVGLNAPGCRFWDGAVRFYCIFIGNGSAGSGKVGDNGNPLWPNVGG